MINNPQSEDVAVGIFPPLLSFITFLIASVLMTISFGVGASVTLNFYFDPSPEAILGVLAVLSIIFFLVNYQVILGSFFAVKVLKLFQYALLVLLIPIVIIEDFSVELFIVKLVSAVLAMSSIFILDSKKYRIFVQHRLNSVKDYKSVLAEIAAEEGAKY
ncbi:hypothetical protein H5125_15150 [Shewanella sp. SR44-4]|jgi:hypothetical protein|uniref:hypothetical protein n=1 Tax=Shewanella TaxID=22 RepID=UPI000C33D3E3|nr:MULTISPECIES: hypothetical protein [unclassified Shewanella]MBB1363483.1 hypothetical protein [Shewanella sp. SR44-4]MBO1897839.1 hypothetical protein [Shewanella sp. BF02_Schw]PKH28478.1 hypothetical protein CXF88_20575 [Shewanella sp. ALD9]